MEGQIDPLYLKVETIKNIDEHTYSELFYHLAYRKRIIYNNEFSQIRGPLEAINEKIKDLLGL